MGVRKKFSDKWLDNLKPAPAGTRLEFWDDAAETTGFGLRVTAEDKHKNFHRTFILAARFPGSANPVRRAIGEYPATGLAEAREKARQWKRMIQRGDDPKEIERRELLAKQRERNETFEVVAEEFIEFIKANKERKAKETARDIRNIFISEWTGRPISEISPHDVEAVIKATVKRGKRARAYNLFGHIRRLFRWAVPLRIEYSPCANLSPRNLIGPRVDRDVILTDEGLRIFWRAVERTRYPYGPLYKLLALSLVRLNEVAGAAWPEFHPSLFRLLRDREPDAPKPDWSTIDPQWRKWTIPASRMKKPRGGEARPHIVALTDAMLDHLWEVPHFEGGQFLFSNDFGKSPLKSNHFSKPKARLDDRMLRTTRAMARKAGADPRQATLRSLIETSQGHESWENHDIRRTGRTHLSALRIPEDVREAVLAHVKGGIKGTYDRYKYLDEKHEALELWAARLRGIVEPALDNIVTLRAA